MEFKKNLRQSISHLEFYDEVTNFERYVGMYVLKIFEKRIISFTKKDYDPVLLQRTLRLVFDPSTVNSHACLFGCALTDRV